MEKSPIMWVEDLRVCSYDVECCEVDCKMEDAMMLEEGRNMTRSGDTIAISTKQLEIFGLAHSRRMQVVTHKSAGSSR